MLAAGRPPPHDVDSRPRFRVIGIRLLESCLSLPLSLSLSLSFSRSPCLPFSFSPSLWRSLAAGIRIIAHVSVETWITPRALSPAVIKATDVPRFRGRRGTQNALNLFRGAALVREARAYSRRKTKLRRACVFSSSVTRFAPRDRRSRPRNEIVFSTSSRRDRVVSLTERLFPRVHGTKIPSFFLSPSFSFFFL